MMESGKFLFNHTTSDSVLLKNTILTLKLYEFVSILGDIMFQ